MNASKVDERSPGALDDPRCLWRPEAERTKGDLNMTNIDVKPDAQEAARQGTRAQELAGKARNVQHAACCIVGGGPAGAMLGLLLARKGVDVLVLEKHGDFLRDFRGDTIHPSTMEIMDELSLAEKLLRVKHTKAPRLRFRTPQATVTVADFRRLKTRFPYVAFMPQWDFLDFVMAEAKRYPNFRLEMNAEVKAGGVSVSSGTSPHSSGCWHPWCSSGALSQIRHRWRCSRRGGRSSSRCFCRRYWYRS